MRRFIKIKTDFVGYHKYPTASIDHSNAIAFLENLHRHKFYVYLTLETQHSDREKEFFIVKEQLERIIEQLKLFTSVNSTTNMSCEMMAEFIYKGMSQYYDLENEFCEIKVSEDNENSVILIWGK